MREDREIGSAGPAHHEQQCRFFCSGKREAMSFVIIIDKNPEDALKLQQVIMAQQSGHSFAILSGSEETMQYYMNGRLLQLMQASDALKETDKEKDKKRKKPMKKVINIETHEMGAVLAVEDIISMEVLGNNCTIYTENQHYRLKRGTLEKKLAEIDDPAIIRCHKSYALNLRWIKGWRKVERNIWEPVYNGQVTAPCLISKTYYDDVRRNYISFSGGENAR